MVAILVFACADEIACILPSCLGCFLYDLADVATICVLIWETKCLMQGLREDALFEVVRAKATSRYVAKFRDAGISREYAEVV